MGYVTGQVAKGSRERGIHSITLCVKSALPTRLTGKVVKRLLAKENEKTRKENVAGYVMRDLDRKASAETCISFIMKY